MLTTLMLVLAGIAGWTVDDFCGTPPRPLPWPGPGPWIRKILAVLGGIGAVFAFRGILPADNAGAVSIIVVGGIGGAFVASLGSMLMGGRAANPG